MIVSYFEDIRPGDTSTTRARTITEADIVGFAMLSGDWHPIHTDVEYAATDPRFGQRIAHGALVLSVALGLVTFWPPATRAFYGLDGLRFLAPTYIGDTLHVETEIVAVDVRADEHAVVAASLVVRNQRGTQVATAIVKMLVAGRGAAGGRPTTTAGPPGLTPPSRPVEPR